MLDSSSDEKEQKTEPQVAKEPIQSFNVYAPPYGASVFQEEVLSQEEE
jgi:hypothetical protein